MLSRASSTLRRSLSPSPTRRSKTSSRINRSVYNLYVIQQGDTLASVASLFGTDDSTLISLNLLTADIFPAGTALYLSGGDIIYTLKKDDTFDQVASSHSINIDELASRNSGAALIAVNQSPDNLVLAIPNLVQLPPGSLSQYYSSYLARGGSETIQDIIQKYSSWSVPGFVTLNQAVPGLFAPEQLSETNITPKLTDTIITLAQALGITPQAFVGQFQAQPDILRAGALVLCPPLTTPPDATLANLAQTYNLTSPLAIAQANSALQGLLQSQTFTYTYTPPKGGPITKQYITGPNDTFVTVVTQLNSLFNLTTITLEDVLDQNPAVQLAANQVIVPPPAEAMLPALTVTLLNSYSDPIFQLKVELQMFRDQNWVAPDFQNDSSVFSNTAPIAASPLSGDDDPLSLSAFATNFEKAFAGSQNPFRGFKLGTGEVESSGSSTQPQLWVVNFDPTRNGIEFTANGAQVQFFALQPLSNQLWTEDGVLVPTYTSGQPLQWTQNKNFQNVNLDAWLATVLGAIDQVLSPQYSIPAYQLGATAQSLLTDILTYKGNIAEGLRALVNYLLAGQSGDLDSAREALYQQALITLSSVYNTTVLVQFPFTVGSPYTNIVTAPLLSGKPVANPYTVNGTITNSTQVIHQLQSGDTFVSIANQFGITVIDLVVANKDVANVFEPTSTITVLVEGEPVIVTADDGDTLSTIAGKVYNNQPPSDEQIQDLAIALWSIDLTGGKQQGCPGGGCGYTLYTNPPAGTPPTTLKYIEVLPVASFTTGKLPLSQGQSSVTFLLNIRNPELQRMAFFDLEYSVNKLEYNIQFLPIVAASAVNDNYVESSWLTFIKPLDAVSFGQVQVPIPLRAYPTFPVLSEQSAVASYPDSPDLEKAKQWDYEFVLNSQFAAQDSMDMGLFFNRLSDQPPMPPTQEATSNLVSDNLYVALAQFMEVYAPIQVDLALLLSDPTNSATLPALQAFHDLAEKVSTAWQSAAPKTELVNDEDGEIHWYQFDTIINEQVADQFQFLVLTNQEPKPLWPDINQKPYTLQVGDEALYSYTEPISTPLDLEFAFDYLDAIQRQNGWSGVLVIRNQDLLGSSSLDEQTNPNFVYQTPLTLFSNKITPYLLIDVLAPLSGTATTLAQALGDFFTVLFKTAAPSITFDIKVQCQYAYIVISAATAASGEIAQELESGQSIMTSLPLVLNPLATFDPATDADPANPNSFVSLLAQAAMANATAIGVVSSTGETIVPGMYLFDVSVYSSLTSSNKNGATVPSKPILDIRNRYWESPK